MAHWIIAHAVGQDGANVSIVSIASGASDEPLALDAVSRKLVSANSQTIPPGLLHAGLRSGKLT